MFYCYDNLKTDYRNRMFWLYDASVAYIIRVELSSNHLVTDSSLW